MRKWRWALLAVLAIISVVVLGSLPSAIHKARMDMRLRQALSFPEEGYVLEHQSLLAAAEMKIERNTEGSWRLIVDVTVNNIGDRPFMNVLAAAKVDERIGLFCAMGKLTLHMIEPADMLTSGLSPTGIGIGRSTPLVPSMTEADRDRLIALLEEPIFVKIVHDDGVELLSVRPKVTLVIDH
jgi:hypothetical protein